MCGAVLVARATETFRAATNKQGKGTTLPLAGDTVFYKREPTFIAYKRTNKYGLKKS
jgi:hypothetical protein